MVTLKNHYRKQPSSDKVSRYTRKLVIALTVIIKHPIISLSSGRSSVWLERHLGVVEAASSSLVAPTYRKTA